jgi:hypothetical protein
MLQDDPTFDPYDPLASRRAAESSAVLKTRLAEAVAFKARVPEMKSLLTGPDANEWLRQCHNVYALLSIAEDFNAESMRYEGGVVSVPVMVSWHPRRRPLTQEAFWARAYTFVFVRR